MKNTIHKPLFKYSRRAILVIAFFAISIGAYAQAEGLFDPPTGSRKFADILEHIADWVKLVGIPVIIFFLVLSGIYYVTAQGNEEKLKQAHTILIWTLVGAAVIAGASAIASAIIEFAKRLGTGS
jgi:small-conductance mechanosensitive channel